MKKAGNFLTGLRAKAYQKFVNFKNDEHGDTNFISIIIIIAIVVVFAGLFLTLGKNLINTVSNKVTKFINGL